MPYDSLSGHSTPILFLKATTKKQLWIPQYTKKNGQVVGGHYTMVHFTDDHDTHKVASGQGSYSQKKAHAALQAEPGFHALDASAKAAVIMHQATQIQDQESMTARLATLKKKLLGGGKPTAGEWKWFHAAPSDKQGKITNDVHAAGHGALMDSLYADYINTQPAASEAEPLPEAPKEADKPAPDAPAPAPIAEAKPESAKTGKLPVKPNIIGSLTAKAVIDGIEQAIENGNLAEIKALMQDIPAASGKLKWQKVKAYGDAALAHLAAQGESDAVPAHEQLHPELAAHHASIKEAIAKEDAKAKEKAAAVAAHKPFDHGELNIPGKTNNIDAELDKYKEKQAAAAKVSAAQATADKKQAKASAKAIFQEHGDLIAGTTAAKMGKAKKEITALLDDMVKWEPNKMLLLWDKFQKENPDLVAGPAVAAEPAPAPAAPAEDDPAAEAFSMTLAASSLPSSNTNAPSFNAKLQAISDAFKAGDTKALLAMSYGTNTYGKKAAKLANEGLALLASRHQVAAGQKAGAHAAVAGKPAAVLAPPAPPPPAPPPPAAMPAANMATPVKPTGLDEPYQILANMAENALKNGYVSSISKVMDALYSKNMEGMDTPLVNYVKAVHAIIMSSAGAPAASADKPEAAAAPAPSAAVVLPGSGVKKEDLPPTPKFASEQNKDYAEKAEQLALADDVSAFYAFYEHAMAERGHMAKLANHLNAVKAVVDAKYGGQPADGPKEGETKAGAGGLLVFKDGRWHKVVGAASGATSTPTAIFIKPQPAAPGPAALGNEEAIDAWTQTAGQKGYNAGAFYKDPDGQEWYVKFPAGGGPVIQNELLACKLYELAGVAVPEIKKIRQGGKLGLASKVIHGAQENKAALLAGMPAGMLDAFAVHAWLANWDAVGNNPSKGFDNILVDGAGKAHHIDQGGALTYGGAGGKKQQFGDAVIELETMLDPGKNTNTALVFGKMSQSDIAASVKKVAMISDAMILNMVLEHGPGQLVERNQLAAKLIARKHSMLAKFPQVAAALNKAAPKPPKPPIVFDPSKLGAAPDFLNWKGVNQSGPASSHDKNALNQEGVDTLLALAKTGSIQAITEHKFPFVTGDGTISHYVAALDHPSQYVKGFAQQLINEIESQMNPPKPFRWDGDSPISALHKAYPKVDLKAAAAVKKLGYFVELGNPGVIDNASVGITDKHMYGKGLTRATYSPVASAIIKKIPKLQKDALKSYTSTGFHAINQSLWKGNPSGAAQSAGEALITMGHEIKPGTVLSRKFSLSGTDLEQLKASTGKVLQEPAVMSTSICPAVWSGNIHLKMTVGPGVKGLWVGIGSEGAGKALSVHANEDEILLPPNTRILIQKVSKHGATDSDGFGSGGYIVEVLILPSE